MHYWRMRDKVELDILSFCSLRERIEFVQNKFLSSKDITLPISEFHTLSDVGCPVHLASWPLILKAGKGKALTWTVAVSASDSWLLTIEQQHENKSFQYPGLRDALVAYMELLDNYELMAKTVIHHLKKKTNNVLY